MKSETDLEHYWRTHVREPYEKAVGKARAKFGDERVEKFLANGEKEVNQ